MALKKRVKTRDDALMRKRTRRLGNILFGPITISQRPTNNK